MIAGGLRDQSDSLGLTNGVDTDERNVALDVAIVVSLSLSHISYIATHINSAGHILFFFSLPKRMV